MPCAAIRTHMPRRRRNLILDRNMLSPDCFQVRLAGDQGLTAGAVVAVPETVAVGKLRARVEVFDGRAEMRVVRLEHAEPRQRADAATAAIVDHRVSKVDLAQSADSGLTTATESLVISVPSSEIISSCLRRSSLRRRRR